MEGRTLNSESDGLIEWTLGSHGCVVLSVRRISIGLVTFDSAVPWKDVVVI